MKQRINPFDQFDAQYAKRYYDKIKEMKIEIRELNRNLSILQKYSKQLLAIKYIIAYNRDKYSAEYILCLIEHELQKKEYKYEEKCEEYEE